MQQRLRSTVWFPGGELEWAPARGSRCPQVQGARVASSWGLTYHSCQAVCCLHYLMYRCIISYRSPLHAAPHTTLLLSPCHSGFPKNFPRLAATLPRAGGPCCAHVCVVPTPSSCLKERVLGLGTPQLLGEGDQQVFLPKGSVPGGKCHWGNLWMWEGSAGHRLSPKP